MTILTLTTILCLASTIVFVVLYGTYKWYSTPTGWTIMTLTAGVAGLSMGGLIYSHSDVRLGSGILASAYLLVAAVMISATLTMWRMNNPREEEEEDYGKPGEHPRHDEKSTRSQS